MQTLLDTTASGRSGSPTRRPTRRLGVWASVGVGLTVAAGIGVTAAIGLSRSLGALVRQIEARGEQQAQWAAGSLEQLEDASAANVARSLDVLVEDQLRAQAAATALFVEAAESAGREPAYVVDALRQIAVRSPIERIDVVPVDSTGPGYGTARDALAWRDLESVFRRLAREAGGLETAGLAARERGSGITKAAAASAAHRDAVVRIEYRIDTAEAAVVYGTEGDRLARALADQQAGAAARLLTHAVELAMDAGWAATRIQGSLERIAAVTAVERIVVLDGGVEAYGAATADADRVGRVPGHREAMRELAGRGQGMSPLEGWYGPNRRWVAAAAATRNAGRVTLSVELETHTGVGTLVETAWQTEVDRLGVATGVRGVWVAELGRDHAPRLVAAAPRTGLGATVTTDAWSRWSDERREWALRRQAVDVARAGAPLSRALVDVLRPDQARVLSGAPVGSGVPAVAGHVVVIEQDAREAAAQMRDQAAWLTGSALALVLVLAVGTVVTTRRVLTDPIEAIAEATDCLRGGVRPAAGLTSGLGARPDEIGSLARNFDAMADEVLMRHDELNREVQKRTRSLQDAHDRIQATQVRMDQDVQVAQSVQAALVPDESWSLDGLEIRCRVTPARHLSGDFLNVQPRGDGDMFVGICDVSGKGVAASLFMAVAQTVLSTAAGRHRAIDRVASEANRRLCQRNPICMFVTGVIAVVDPATSLVRYVCAGHEAPYVLGPGGALRKLERPGNMPLGLDESVPFKAMSFQLAPGETIVAYTDGVTDAVDSSGEAFGDTRLRELLEAFPLPGGVDDLLESIWTETVRFSAGEAQTDDQTVLLVHRPLEVDVVA